MIFSKLSTIPKRFAGRKDENVSSTWPGSKLLGILLKGELAKAGKLFLGRQLFCLEQMLDAIHFLMFA